MTPNERRQYPRIDDNDLSLELKADGFDTITHSLNISASGIYCKVDKPMPAMSRIKLVLMVPTAGGATRVETTGVVVREHPVIINGETKHYDVAIFFEDLLPEYRDAIANYVTQKKR